MDKILDVKTELHKYKVGDYVKVTDTGEEACIIDIEYDTATETYVYNLKIGSKICFLTEDCFTPLFARKISSANCGVSAKQEHYQNSALQPIQVMQRIMSKEQFYGFLMGNFIKYSMRMSHKKSESVEKEKEKARQYAYWAELAKKDVIIDPIEHSVPPEFEYKGL